MTDNIIYQGISQTVRVLAYFYGLHTVSEITTYKYPYKYNIVKVKYHFLSANASHAASHIKWTDFYLFTLEGEKINPLGFSRGPLGNLRVSLRTRKTSHLEF